MTNLFLAFDGDHVGRRVEHMLLAGEVDGLVEFSRNVAEAVDTIARLLEVYGGEVLLRAGDSVLATLQGDPGSFLEGFAERRREFPCSFCTGVGESLQQAYLALKFAKSCGEGTTVFAIRAEDRTRFEVRPERESRWRGECR